jgi:hypothetical protein
MGTLKSNQEIEVREVHEEGFWWFPETPETRFFGTFEFTQEKAAILFVRGLLSIDVNLVGSKTIFGDCGGVAITIAYAALTESNIEFGQNDLSRQKQTWISKLVLWGDHNANVEKNLYSSFTFSSKLLPNWLNSALAKKERQNDSITLRIEVPAPLKFEISEIGEISIDYLESFKSSYLEETVSLFPIVSVSCSQPISILDFHTRVLRPFLFITSLVLDSSDFVLRSTIQIPKSDEVPRTKIIEILSDYFMSSEPTEIIQPFAHLIKFKDVENEELSFLTRRFDLFRENEELYNEYFSIRYSKFHYLEDKFARIFRVLEASNRSGESGIIVDESEYSEFLERNSLILSKEDLEFLKERFAKFEHLKTVFDQIISNTSSTLVKIIATWPTFIKTLVETRHKVTHAKRDVKVLDPEEMYFAEKYLDLIFIVSLLRKLGISEDLIKVNLENNNKFRYLNQYMGRRISDIQKAEDPSI